FLPRVALREAVDELVLRVRDQADQAAVDLRVAVRHPGIDEQHGDLAVALEILRPGATGVAVQPDEPVFELEPNRVQLDGAVGPPGRDRDQDRQRRKLLNCRAQRRSRLTSSRRWRRWRA